MEEIRLTEEDMKGFTYILWWPDHNLRYYGVKYARGCKTEEIGKTYFSSSKKVKQFWEEHGKPVIIIDAMFTSIDEARDYEEYILKENDVRNDDSWLNQTDNKSFTPLTGELHPNKRPENRQRLSRIKKGVPNEKIRGDQHYMRKNPEKKAHLYGENSVSKRPDIRKRKSEKLKGKKNPQWVGDNNPMKKPENRAKALEALKKPEVIAKFSGKNHYGYDHTIRIFKHKDHGEHISTRYDFIKKYNLRSGCVINLISGRSRERLGWTYHGTIDEPREPKPKRTQFGSDHPSYDSQIRIFHHISHGLVEMTRYDFYTNYNLTSDGVFKLIKGITKCHKGWQYIGLAEDQPE